MQLNGILRNITLFSREVSSCLEEKTTMSYYMSFVQIKASWFLPIYFQSMCLKEQITKAKLKYCEQT